MIHNVDTTWRIPRESKEWIGPLVITQNGVPTNDYEVQLVREYERPIEANWAAPIVDGTDRGIVVGPNEVPGMYRIFARRTTALESVVLRVGVVIVT